MRIKKQEDFADEDHGDDHYEEDDAKIRINRSSETFLMETCFDHRNQHPHHFIENNKLHSIN